MPGEEQSFQKPPPKGSPIGKEVLDTLYHTCGYTPSDEISKLLNTEENIFPALE
jgi:hypothetical protein